MDTTQYLPDLKGVDVGSEAQEDLRFALHVVEEARENARMTPRMASAYDGAIDTLRFLTSSEDV